MWALSHQYDVSSRKTNSYDYFQWNIAILFLFPVADSPSLAKSAKGDTIGIRQRLKAIAKTLVENNKKWDAAHRRGTTLCKAIERCKSHAIRQFNDAEAQSSERSLYPADLKSSCDKLRVITTIFEDVCKSSLESQVQADSYIQLGASNIFAENRLVFRTWSCDRFLDAVKLIHEAYRNEYQAKLHVLENIAHSKIEDELTLHLAAWEYQMHVNQELEIVFKALITEADIELDDKT